MKKNYPDQDLFEFCDSSHQLFLEKLIKIQSSIQTLQGKSDDVDPVGIRGCIFCTHGKTKRTHWGNALQCTVLSVQNSLHRRLCSLQTVFTILHTAHHTLAVSVTLHTALWLPQRYSPRTQALGKFQSNQKNHI